MGNYGKAFKIIRLIKDINLDAAAEGLDIDTRTLRDIESGKSSVITDRFDQMIKFYQVKPEIILDLAVDQTAFQNVIHEVKRDNIFNQSTTSEKETLERLISSLETRIQQLEANDVFHKNMINKLLND